VDPDPVQERVWRPERGHTDSEGNGQARNERHMNSLRRSLTSASPRCVRTVRVRVCRPKGPVSCSSLQSGTSRFAACFSRTQFAAACCGGLLIPRSQVRVLPGPSDLQGKRGRRALKMGRGRTRCVPRRFSSTLPVAASCRGVSPRALRVRRMRRTATVAAVLALGAGNSGRECRGVVLERFSQPYEEHRVPVLRSAVHRHLRDRERRVRRCCGAIGRAYRTHYVSIPYRVPILQYGTFWSAAGLRCVSRSTGMTCRAPSGHGFFLERHSYNVW
jgi:hypothetical protein